MIQLFAIRLKGTEDYLPALPVRRKHGYSFTVPTSATKEMPRWFTDRDSAERALTSWLQGEHNVKRSHSTSYFGEVEADEYAVVVRKPDRKRELMEIVAFDLAEVEEKKPVPCLNCSLFPASHRDGKYCFPETNYFEYIPRVYSYGQKK